MGEQDAQRFQCRRAHDAIRRIDSGDDDVWISRSDHGVARGSGIAVDCCCLRRCFGRKARNAPLLLRFRSVVEAGVVEEKIHRISDARARTERRARHDKAALCDLAQLHHLIWIHRRALRCFLATLRGGGAAQTLRLARRGLLCSRGTRLLLLHVRDARLRLLRYFLREEEEGLCVKSKMLGGASQIVSRIRTKCNVYKIQI